MAVESGGRSPRKLVLWVAVLGVILVVGSQLVTELYVEILWHAEMGTLSVFWKRALWSWGTRVVAGAAVGGVLFLNLRIMAPALGGIHIRRRFGNLEINEQLPKHYVRWGILGLSAVMGLWFGLTVTPATGLRLLLAWTGQAWGIQEPVLGADASFYVFTLPLLRVAVTLGLLTAFLALTLSAAGYTATGSLSWDRNGLTMSDASRRHLGVIVASFFVLIAIHFWLSRYTLLLQGTSDVHGIFGFTDAQARLPGYRILGWICLVGAFAVVFGSWRNRMATIFAGFGVVLIGGLVVGGLYPSLVQRFRVEPNELVRETPYIDYNIEFSRLGFGLEGMRRERFEYTRPGTEGTDGTVDWNLALDQFAGLPVWSQNTLLTTFRELEARFRYYDFARVDMDRYATPGSEAGDAKPVAVSVREIDPEGIEDPNWQNRHIRERYIVGMGAVASATADRTPEGRPPMYLSAIPPEFSGGPDAPEGLRLEHPSVFIGSTPQPYAILNPGPGAFLAPDGTPGVAGVDYPEGIPLDGLFRKLTFALTFGDWNLLFAQEITDASRFVFRRNVVERVRRIAPFFVFPESPYPVVHDGRLVWILEGFTATRGFPLASPRDFDRRPASYVRNSLKATVDAVTGEVSFYALPEPDPLLDAYRAAFPELVRPFDEMPQGIRSHLRYSPTHLGLQADVLLQYHQNTAPQFHGQQDVWENPREMSETTSPVPYQPEFGLYRLPGDEADHFYLTTLFVPAGRQNLTGVLGGRFGSDGVRELRLFDVPVEDQVPGPRQVEALVEQDPEISQQFSLWRTGGSRVWTGHLHLVPVDGHILYMEAVFLAAEADAIPQLRGFVVSDGNRVVMEPTLTGAVTAISGASTGGPGRESGQEGAPGTDVAADPSVAGASTWPAEALELLDTAESRIRQGDYEGFGRALAELRALLERLRGGAGS